MRVKQICKNNYILFINERGGYNTSGSRITFRHTKGQSGLFVGLFREFPFILSQAKTKDELLNNLQKNLALYFNTFPEGLEKLKKYGRMVENEKISDKNIDGQKAPPFIIEKPEIASDKYWIEKELP